MFRGAASLVLARTTTSHGRGPVMGDVIRLDQRRAAARQGPMGRASTRLRATFYFDLASPFTYLAAERVDRLFPALTWRPALAEALHAGNPLGAAAARHGAHG